MLILFDTVTHPNQFVNTPWGVVGYAKVGEMLVIDAKSNPQAEAAPYAAKRLGASRVLFICRDSGAEQPSVPNQFIEFTTERTTTYFTAVGTGYVQQNPPFCPELSEVATANGCADGGTLLVADPITPTGRDWWQKQGIEAISRDSQPCGALCRELELCFAVLLLPAATDAVQLCKTIQAQLPESASCECAQSMAFAKKIGKLPADWEEWFV